MEGKPELKVILLQQDLVWEDISANLALFENCIKQLSEPVDLVVLPEMFSTGFTMQAEIFAEDMSGRTIQKMQEWAKVTGAAICGSIIIKEAQSFYNRFVWVEPNGNIEHYDKAHLFRMGEEEQHYTRGKKQILIHYKGWNIAPFVCYDLRFPVWLRKTASFNYDLLLMVANWPERRSKHWDLLLQARAIENQAYVVAVNRIGNDGKEIYHNGNSAAIDPLGNIICKIEHEAAIKEISLNMASLQTYKESFPLGLDTDKFEIC